MKKVIVTGLTGMDCRTLVYQLLRRGDKVVGTIRSNTDQEDVIRSWYQFEPNSENLTIEYCDVNDYSSVAALLTKHNDASEFYHLAAQSHVGKSFNSPYETCITNGMSVFNALDFIHKTGMRTKFYFAATSELFGGKEPKDGGYDESDEYDCRSPYSIGKELGTRWVKYYRQMGVFACYGVLFNHSNIYRNQAFMIQKTCMAAAKIANGQQSELVLGNLNFYRDEHWSDFGVEAMTKMLARQEPKDYVIATGTTHHGEEFLDEAFGYFNLNWRDYVKFDKDLLRPNEVVKLIGNSSLAQKELEWNPERITFKQHIGEMCEYNNFSINNSGIIRPHKNYLEIYKNKNGN